MRKRKSQKAKRSPQEVGDDANADLSHDDGVWLVTRRDSGSDNDSGHYDDRDLWTSRLLPGGFDLSDAALLLYMCLHVFVCPYTKVEESFNMQALHDIYEHSTNISAYDHLQFPGVVPRSFFGPLAVQGFLLPIHVMLRYLYPNDVKFSGQLRGQLYNALFFYPKCMYVIHAFDNCTSHVFT